MSCKACGMSFCDLHSQYQIVLKALSYDSPQRICNECFSKYTPLRFLKRTKASKSLLQGYDPQKKGLIAVVNKFIQIRYYKLHILVSSFLFFKYINF